MKDAMNTPHPPLPLKGGGVGGGKRALVDGSCNLTLRRK